MSQNFRVATFIPITNPAVSPAVIQTTGVKVAGQSPLSTTFATAGSGGGGGGLPPANSVGDLLQADLSLQWVPGQSVDAGRI